MKSLTPTRAALGVGAILVAALVAYYPVLENGFVWDDDHYVTHNRTLRSLDGLGRIWFDYGAVPQYYPLVHTSFWVEYRLWGLEPLGFHLDNVLLHGLSAGFLWLALRRLRIPGAWFAALVFALHPVQVESVAWVTERKNVLSGLFYALALLSWLRFDPLSADETPPSRRNRFYWLSLALFVCALLSKTVACSFPAVILLLVWWKRGVVRAADVRATAPFFVIGAALAALTVVMETSHVGATGGEWSLSFVDRCLIAGRALWFYSAKLAWPVALTFIYPRWTIDSSSVVQYAYPLAFAAVVAGLWFARQRISRAPLVAVLIFAGTLLPALGFVNVYPMRYSFVADHFQYQAAMALIVLACAVATGAAGRVRGGVHVLRVAAVVLGLTLGLLTFRQTAAYRDAESLWRDTLDKNPAAWIAHNNLAVIHLGRQEHEQALTHIRATLELNPNHANAYVNLAGVLDRQERTAEAEQALEDAIRVDPQNPLGYQNLAVMRNRRGLTNEAIDLLQQAIALEPRAGAPRLNLARIYQGREQYAEAEEQFRAILAEDPDHLDALRRYMVFLVEQGRYEESVPYRRRILRLE